MSMSPLLFRRSLHSRAGQTEPQPRSYPSARAARAGEYSRNASNASSSCSFDIAATAPDCSTFISRGTRSAHIFMCAAG